MEAGLVARAAVAASSLARDLDLPVEDAVVVQNSNTLALRLLPCDVFARTALVGQEIAAFEVLVAQNLGAVSAPIASLHPRVEPRVYERDGFAVTFWTYYDSVTDTASPARYANALHRLHGAMQNSDVEAPHFTERIAAAEGLLTNRHETPALLDADRTLLLETLRGGRQAMCSVNAEQLLHGEPHPGNLLVTRNGLLFIDLETCCRGPVEFDVAHAPDEVSAGFPLKRGHFDLADHACPRFPIAAMFRRSAGHVQGGTTLTGPSTGRYWAAEKRGHQAASPVCKARS